MARLFLPTLLLAAVIAPCAANAQANGNAAAFNAGYGQSSGDENKAAAQSTIRDANGNLLMVDGRILTANGGSASYGSNQSGVGANTSAVSAQSFSGGAGRYASGAGSASSMAVGNQLNVVTTGNYNTVVINSTQTNNGAVTAGSVGNGGVSNAN